ncbi:hypothetical protein DP144_08985 [Clostridium tetani]|uniref:hypothetical protein n=1 Tax=Clostridium tetani TaxID=1513 RepID=UPI00100BBB98|nr:hypothetical protein [Clostridium tetani]RXM75489.1 hypothetical protein DP154_08980 [Clostridium tetani]RYU98732.1 hypothetical protein DP144_08985 [Clostridium tetani]
MSDYLKNITIEDVRQIKIDDLENIAKYIINSSGFLEELNKYSEFNNSDWFKKIEDNFKKTTLKIKNNINLVHTDMNNVSKKIITPLNNVYSQVEDVGKIYS